MVDPDGRGRARGRIGRLAVAGWVGAALAGGGGAARAQGPAAPIEGRVVDERGRPLAAAVVHLYRHDNAWADPDPEVEEVQTGADGTFRLATPPPPAAPVGGRDAPTLVLIAEHPGLAVGWKKVPAGASFRGEIRLTDHPQTHTVAVIDEAGRPLAGATVAVNGLGDAEAPTADLRESVDLKPAAGPLTATTDAAGLARFANLPPNHASFTAIKPGYARNYRLREPIPIRLTPAGILEGTLTGPTGEPLRGVGIALYTTFMWELRFATTDDRGRYRVADLKPRGWDMAAWGAGRVGDGGYRLWLRSDKFAVPTQSIVLGPGERRTLDLQAQPAGIIRVVVVEDGTIRRVPGVRVWGFDRETGSSARFDATTDAQGVATFASVPAEISLSIASPPEGTFLLENAWGFDGAHAKFDFAGGEVETTLTLPTVGGRLVAVAGRCVGPDRAPLPAVKVHATSEVPTGYLPPRRLDAAGGFTLDGIPAGRNLGLHALSDDGQLGGWLAARVPKPGAAAVPLVVPMRLTVAVELILADEAGAPLGAQDVAVTPRIGPGARPTAKVELSLPDEAGAPPPAPNPAATPKVGLEFGRLRRYVRTDERGRVVMDRVIPGLTYHVDDVARGLAHEVEAPPGSGPVAAAARAALGSDVVLAPAADR